MLKKLADSVYAMHANLSNEPVFEGFWPIPTGVTLNSYLVKGAKTALIDLVSDAEGAADQLAAQCVEAGVSLDAIDYLVVNHLESDHCAYIPALKKRNPRLELIATEKGAALLRNFFGISDGIRAVHTGDTLDLGGTTLSFIETPNIHWPETMMTWEAQSGILFSCDAFGSYGATGERLFDDEFSAGELKSFADEALRYYATIVASFSAAVKPALEKLKALPVKIVAPSHGIVWRTRPQTIIDLYTAFAGTNTGGAQEKEICVVCGSMYGCTRQGLEAIIKGIKAEGVPFVELTIPQTDSSVVLANAYRRKGLVLAMPTYEYKMYPPMAQALELMGRKHFQNKIALRVGSWGWVGGAQKDYEALTAAFKWTQLPAYEWQGLPKPNDLAALEERGRQIARAVLES